MPNIGIISTFLPIQCGIATYSDNLIRSIKSINGNYKFIEMEVAPNVIGSYSKNYLIQDSNAEQYLKACDYINNSSIDIIDIQHEFKIFGKPDGENILIFLDCIKKPISTTIHTVFSSGNEQREKILEQIVKRSDMLYVFSKESKNNLIGKYKKTPSKVQIIPHGVPLIRYKEANQFPERKNFPDSLIFVSAGHMRNTKGYELALIALDKLKREMPDFKYIILGSNHPQNETAKLYRETLLQLVKELNLSDQVIFISEYLSEKDLIKYIQLADIGLLPYNRKDQSSSGILALMLACGRPVVSTPFQFAKSYINEYAGVIADSFDYSDFEKAIKVLLNKRHLWNEISQHNYNLGQNWNWEKVAHKYISGYRTLIHDYSYV